VESFWRRAGPARAAPRLNIRNRTDWATAHRHVARGPPICSGDPLYSGGRCCGNSTFMRTACPRIPGVTAMTFPSLSIVIRSAMES
jgi:hypothetical protein